MYVLYGYLHPLWSSVFVDMNPHVELLVDIDINSSYWLIPGTWKE